MEKRDIIQSITNEMTLSLTKIQIDKLKDVLYAKFENIELTEITDELKKLNEKETNEKYIEMFISSKKVEGCSGRTIKYYKETIDKLISNLNKAIKNITTEDIRNYLSKYKEETNCSATTIDNVRRIFSTFFSWLEDEDYIVKSPVRRIHKVKTAITVKETFTDENIETLRDNCKSIRNLSLVEMLYSTGMRVGEIVNLNTSDLNFENRSCIVLCKGNKQREVYFDAKTKLHIQEYIATRNDDNDALFVSSKSPHQRLSIAGIELIIRKIGQATNINKAHPHKFRRTLATNAIDKGMPIEQVQMLLGHVKIETTMHYAMVNQTNVKISHRKYIG